MVYIIAFVGGIIVAIATAVVIGGEDASRLPGGSIGFGLTTGLVYNSQQDNASLLLVVVCVLMAISGWVVFKVVHRLLRELS